MYDPSMKPEVVMKDGSQSLHQILDHILQLEDVMHMQT